MQLSVRVKDIKIYTCDVIVIATSLWSPKAATDLMYSYGKSVRMPDIGLKHSISYGSVQTSFHILTQHLWRTYATPRDLRSWNHVVIQPKNQLNRLTHTVKAAHLIIPYNTVVFSLLTSGYLIVHFFGNSSLRTHAATLKLYRAHAPFLHAGPSIHAAIYSRTAHNITCTLSSLHSHTKYSDERVFHSWSCCRAYKEFYNSQAKETKKNLTFRRPMHRDTRIFLE
jgi:hypothetical protein